MKYIKIKLSEFYKKKTRHEIILWYMANFKNPITCCGVQVQAVVGAPPKYLIFQMWKEKLRKKTIKMKYSKAICIFHSKNCMCLHLTNM